MIGIDDAALAILGAGLISTAGSLYTNRQNLRYQANVNDVNWQIAAQNNATQIEMANTAHQREIDDLRAAGLNPILSAGGNGAVTPSLTSMRGDAAQIENPVNGLANSARSLSRYFGELYKSELETKQADARSAKSESIIANREAMLSNTQYDLDAMRLGVEREAMHRLTHEMVNEDGFWQERWRPNNPLVKLAEQGIQAEAKLRSNQNWRANLSSFVPFVSPAAINSGASAARTFRRFSK